MALRSIVRTSTVVPSAVRSLSTQIGADVEWGSALFSPVKMGKYMKEDSVDAFNTAVKEGAEISDELTSEYADALLAWCKDEKVTHYTHYFHPMSGVTGQKHEALNEIKPDGTTKNTFKAETLVRAEPDGSSFPGGDLRATSTARGYTFWDPASAPFIVDHGNGKTLTIPSMFCSWKGDALDEKIPLLRSNEALKRATLRVLEAAGQEGHRTVHAETGLEQEYFLIDRDMFYAREDLVVTGRTLWGNLPVKGQSLDDHYFGTISDRMLSAMHEVEVELWKMGISQTTRHKEVTPGQYEFAPYFRPVNVATDQNAIVMETLHRVMRKHGLAALLHEKPFAHLNGSGKHNNWSFGTNKIPTLFRPGADPAANICFMIALAGLIRGVDRHGDLLRASIASAENDHRLGGHEAPPAIISVYLGDDLERVVNELIGLDAADAVSTVLDLGVGCVAASVDRDTTDRNRTSPVAYTGNKFEFRAVGSSQASHRSTVALNALQADSLEFMADEITKRGGGPDAAMAVVKEVLSDHKRILFSGDNYSSEWHAEAESRGLPNLAATPQALEAYQFDHTKELFTSTGILSEQELRARYEVCQTEYVTKNLIEGRVLARHARGVFVGAGPDYAHGRELVNTVNLLADEIEASGDGHQVYLALHPAMDALAALVNEAELDFPHLAGVTITDMLHYQD